MESLLSVRADSGGKLLVAEGMVNEVQNGRFCMRET